MANLLTLQSPGEQEPSQSTVMVGLELEHLLGGGGERERLKELLQCTCNKFADSGNHTGTVSEIFTIKHNNQL